MFAGLEIEAALTVSLYDDHFPIVAEDNYVIVNFKDLKAMERVLKNAGTIKFLGAPAKIAVPEKKKSSNPLQLLNDVNAQMLALKLIVDVRVGGKTYVTFGNGKSAKITAAAIFGKIGSFFGR